VSGQIIGFVFSLRQKKKKGVRGILVAPGRAFSSIDGEHRMTGGTPNKKTG